MTKRRILISIAMIVVCICAGSALLAIFWPGPGVTKANFDRVENGMTLAQVEQIFGEPPSVPNHLFGDSEVWSDGSGREALITFSARGGKVIDKDWDDRSETIYTRIRRLLGLGRGH